MTGNNSVLGGLSPQQRLAVTELASGATRLEAALKAGVSESTLYRWLREEPFAQALHEAIDAVSDLLDRRLGNYAQAALSTVLRIMMDDMDNTPPSVKLAAASKVLDNAFRVRELDVVGRRIEKLERMIAERDQMEVDEEDEGAWEAEGEDDEQG